MALALVGRSPQISHLREVIEKLKISNTPVLLQGETGTGKEIVARLIHGSKGEFVAFSCGAVHSATAGPALFGVSEEVVGGPQLGLLALAEGGTIFLDELECLPCETQLQLLRVLQDQSFQPCFSTNPPRRLNVRILSATNVDLEKLSKSGGFQQDLYYHLSAVTLQMTPLRERKEDIPDLIEFFIAKHAKENGKAPEYFSLSKECLDAMVGYYWPGNVRELHSALNHILIFSKGQTLRLDDLPPKILTSWVPFRSAAGIRVFLCHSSADKKSIRDLYEWLQKRGLKPWLDEYDLLAGQEWQPAITKAVRSSNIVLVCLSRNAVTKEGFVQKEIRIALDAADEKPEGSIFLIPVRLEPCEVPDRLRKWQWLDLFEGNGLEKLMVALATRANDREISSS